MHNIFNRRLASSVNPAEYSLSLGASLQFEPLSRKDCNLHPERIDIWQLDLSAVILSYTRFLDKDETDRANRFHFPHHRRRFIAAHVLTRTILGLYLKQNPETLLIKTQKQGKPQVKNTLGLEFNLSHSQDYALLAIGQSYELGIDIELFSDRSYTGIAEHTFSAEELQVFSNLPLSWQARSFFHIWAQKEALIKACGLGMTYPLQSLSTACLPPPHYSLLDPVHQKEWQLFNFVPIDPLLQKPIDCAAALCCDLPIKTLRYSIFSNEDL